MVVVAGGIEYADAGDGCIVDMEDADDRGHAGDWIGSMEGAIVVFATGLVMALVMVLVMRVIPGTIWAVFVDMGSFLVCILPRRTPRVVLVSTSDFEMPTHSFVLEL